jgi:hypothetical protein
LPGATHWRKCVWTGTPAECIKAFGCIPDGTALFIWTAGHNDKYNDELGDAGHMGLVWGKYTSIAASASRGQVIESNFAGKEISGGWNRIGLLPWVDYNLTDAQKALLTTAATVDGEDVTAEVEDTDGGSAASAPDTSKFVKIKKGCKGGAVERLQTWLVDLGYTLTVDHDFGPATDNAVRYFQITHGLTEDGVVGSKTWAALAEARYDASAEG